jgi:hypothetical protein
MKRFRLLPTTLQDTKKPFKQKATAEKATFTPLEEHSSDALRKGYDFRLGSRSMSLRFAPGRGDEVHKSFPRLLPNQATRDNQLADKQDVETEIKTYFDFFMQRDTTEGVMEESWYLPQLKILDYFTRTFDPFNSLPGPSSKRKAMFIHHYCMLFPCCVLTSHEND